MNFYLIWTALLSIVITAPIAIYIDHWMHEKAETNVAREMSR